MAALVPVPKTIIVSDVTVVNCNVQSAVRTEDLLRRARVVRYAQVLAVKIADPELSELKEALTI